MNTFTRNHMENIGKNFTYRSKICPFKIIVFKATINI